MISICAPIISEQYDNDDSRWGKCVEASKAYLDALIPTLETPEEQQTAVAATVDELLKLYRPQDCKRAETELPLAISTAKSYTDDSVQLIAINDISTAVSACQQIATAAVETQLVDSSAQL